MPDVATVLEQLQERIADLEATVERQQQHIAELETELATHREDSAADRQRIEALADASARKAGANLDRVRELQARELEKGAHLDAEHVEPTTLPTAAKRLERITKDGGHYYRVPDSEDPLDRGGRVQLSHGDLLPIQQLARMDADLLRSATSSLPARLAAKLWRARADPDVGDNPWRAGSRNVREALPASELRAWIRRQEAGVSKSYAQKLVTRTIDAIVELSQHRLAVHERDQRKNGLTYTERYLVLPTAAAIPGETDDAPATAAVGG